MRKLYFFYDVLLIRDVLMEMSFMGYMMLYSYIGTRGARE